MAEENLEMQANGERKNKARGERKRGAERRTTNWKTEGLTWLERESTLISNSFLTKGCRLFHYMAKCNFLTISRKLLDPFVIWFGGFDTFPTPH